MDDERRIGKRHHLIYYLRVWDVEAGDPIGHLADLTTGGFLVVSEEPIDVGRVFALEVQWENDEGEEQRIRLRAESRWSHNDANPDLYDTGFMLVDTAPDVLFPIQDLIEDIGFND